MPSTIVLAYAYRSDYLARCLALDASGAFARSRSLVDQDAPLPVFYLKRLRRAVSRARSVQCVPAIIGRREILVIEDADTRIYIARRGRRRKRSGAQAFLFAIDRSIDQFQPRARARGM